MPDFKDGRSGRFIHDFNSNYTGIVDITGGRCFVMPLDRKKVLAPRDLFDLINKMWSGYYRIDTEIVREKMRVVTPPISDKSTVGAYISQECENMPIYKLERYVGGGELFPGFVVFITIRIGFRNCCGKCKASGLFEEVNEMIFCNVICFPVVKRSADLHVEAKFAQFSGKGITEFDIVNLEDTEPYEQAKVQ